jgi:hypothetical protein
MRQLDSVGSPLRTLDTCLSTQLTSCNHADAQLWILALDLIRTVPNQRSVLKDPLLSLLMLLLLLLPYWNVASPGWDVLHLLLRRRLLLVLVLLLLLLQLLVLVLVGGNQIRREIPS